MLSTWGGAPTDVPAPTQHQQRLLQTGQQQQQMVQQMRLQQQQQLTATHSMGRRPSTTTAGSTAADGAWTPTTLGNSAVDVSHTTTGEGGDDSQPSAAAAGGAISDAIAPLAGGTCTAGGAGVTFPTLSSSTNCSSSCGSSSSFSSSSSSVCEASLICVSGELGGATRGREAAKDINIVVTEKEIEGAAAVGGIGAGDYHVKKARVVVPQQEFISDETVGPAESSASIIITAADTAAEAEEEIAAGEEEVEEARICEEEEGQHIDVPMPSDACSLPSPSSPPSPSSTCGDILAVGERENKQQRVGLFYLAGEPYYLHEWVRLKSSGDRDWIAQIVAYIPPEQSGSRSNGTEDNSSGAANGGAGGGHILCRWGWEPRDLRREACPLLPVEVYSHYEIIPAINFCDANPIQSIKEKVKVEHYSRWCLRRCFPPVVRTTTEEADAIRNGTSNTSSNNSTSSLTQQQQQQRRLKQQQQQTSTQHGENKTSADEEDVDEASSTAHYGDEGDTSVDQRGAREAKSNQQTTETAIPEKEGISSTKHDGEEDDDAAGLSEVLFYRHSHDIEQGFQPSLLADITRFRRVTKSSPRGRCQIPTQQAVAALAAVGGVQTDASPYSLTTTGKGDCQGSDRVGVGTTSGLSLPPPLLQQQQQTQQCHGGRVLPFYRKYLAARNPDVRYFRCCRCKQLFAAPDDAPAPPWRCPPPINNNSGTELKTNVPISSTDMTTIRCGPNRSSSSCIGEEDVWMLPDETSTSSASSYYDEPKSRKKHQHQQHQQEQQQQTRILILRRLSWETLQRSTPATPVDVQHPVQLPFVWKRYPAETDFCIVCWRCSTRHHRAPRRSKRVALTPTGEGTTVLVTTATSLRDNNSCDDTDTTALSELTEKRTKGVFPLGSSNSSISSTSSSNTSISSTYCLDKAEGALHPQSRAGGGLLARRRQRTEDIADIDEHILANRHVVRCGDGGAYAIEDVTKKKSSGDKKEQHHRHTDKKRRRSHLTSSHSHAVGGSDDDYVHERKKQKHRQAILREDGEYQDDDISENVATAGRITSEKSASTEIYRRRSSSSSSSGGNWLQAIAADDGSKASRHHRKTGGSNKKVKKERSSSHSTSDSSGEQSEVETKEQQQNTERRDSRGNKYDTKGSFDTTHIYGETPRAGVASIDTDTGVLHRNKANALVASTDASLSSSVSVASSLSGSGFSKSNRRDRDNVKDDEEADKEQQKRRESRESSPCVIPGRAVGKRKKAAAGVARAAAAAAAAAESSLSSYSEKDAEDEEEYVAGEEEDEDDFDRKKAKDLGSGNTFYAASSTTAGGVSLLRKQRQKQSSRRARGLAAAHAGASVSTGLSAVSTLNRSSGSSKRGKERKDEDEELPDNSHKTGGATTTGMRLWGQRAGGMEASPSPSLGSSSSTVSTSNSTSGSIGVADASLVAPTLGGGVASAPWKKSGSNKICNSGTVSSSASLDWHRGSQSRIERLVEVFRVGLEEWKQMQQQEQQVATPDVSAKNTGGQGSGDTNNNTSSGSGEAMPKQEENDSNGVGSGVEHAAATAGAIEGAGKPGSRKGGGSLIFTTAEACAAAVHAAFLLHHGGLDSRRQKQRFFELLCNLKRSSSTELRMKVLSGELPTQQLVSMEPAELAPAAVIKEREEERERHFREAILLRETPADVLARSRNVARGAVHTEPYVDDIDNVQSNAVSTGGATGLDGSGAATADNTYNAEAGGSSSGQQVKLHGRSLSGELQQQEASAHIGQQDGKLSAAHRRRSLQRRRDARGGDIRADDEDIGASQWSRRGRKKKKERKHRKKADKKGLRGEKSSYASEKQVDEKRDTWMVASCGETAESRRESAAVAGDTTNTQEVKRGEATDMMVRRSSTGDSSSDSGGSRRKTRESAAITIRRKKKDRKQARESDTEEADSTDTGMERSARRRHADAEESSSSDTGDSESSSRSEDSTSSDDSSSISSTSSSSNEDSSSNSSEVSSGEESGGSSDRGEDSHQSNRGSSKNRNSSSSSTHFAAAGAREKKMLLRKTDDHASVSTSGLPAATAAAKKIKRRSRRITAGVAAGGEVGELQEHDFTTSSVSSSSSSDDSRGSTSSDSESSSTNSEGKRRTSSSSSNSEESDKSRKTKQHSSLRRRPSRGSSRITQLRKETPPTEEKRSAGEEGLQRDSKRETYVAAETFNVDKRTGSSSETAAQLGIRVEEKQKQEQTPQQQLESLKKLFAAEEAAAAAASSTEKGASGESRILDSNVRTSEEEERGGWDTKDNAIAVEDNNVEIAVSSDSSRRTGGTTSTSTTVTTRGKDEATEEITDITTAIAGAQGKGSFAGGKKTQQKRNRRKRVAFSVDTKIGDGPAREQKQQQKRVVRVSTELLRLPQLLPHNFLRRQQQLLVVAGGPGAAGGGDSVTINAPAAAVISGLEPPYSCDRYTPDAIKERLQRLLDGLAAAAVPPKKTDEETEASQLQHPQRKQHRLAAAPLDYKSMAAALCRYLEIGCQRVKRELQQYRRR